MSGCTVHVRGPSKSKVMERAIVDSLQNQEPNDPGRSDGQSENTGRFRVSGGKGGPQPALSAEEVQVSETVLLILNLFENQQTLYEF